MTLHLGGNADSDQLADRWNAQKVTSFLWICDDVVQDVSDVPGAAKQNVVDTMTQFQNCYQ